MKTKNILSKITRTASLLLLSACSLDIDNPNGPREEQILDSREGLLNLSVGIRHTYSTQVLESIILTPGTTAHELRGITTFTNIIEVDQGGTVLPNFNGNILSVWQRPLRVMAMADDIITQAPAIIGGEADLLSTTVAHAKLFKAMCLGALAQNFTHGVLQTNATGNASFVDRATLLTTAITLLKEADAALTATPPTTEFNTRVTGTDFNLPNTVRAYLARYSLMAGNYGDAITAAKSVNLNAKSSFTFSTLAPNPLYQQVQISKNYGARDQFGLPPALIEPGDGRLAFYFSSSAANYAGDPLDNLTGFATAISQSIPVYLPDEMRLIVAEASVRSNLLTEAVTEIDAVRTQASGDPFGVHANLPAYSGAVTTDALLAEIYKQRCAELYLSGLRLEDSRRLGRPEPPTNVNPVPLTSERSRNFYPFPQQERQNNANTPGDPVI